MRLLPTLQLKNFDVKCLGWLENYKDICKNKLQVFEVCLLQHHNFCTNGKLSLAGKQWPFYRVIL